jgi:hypothetical protein
MPSPVLNVNTVATVRFVGIAYYTHSLVKAKIEEIRNNNTQKVLRNTWYYENDPPVPAALPIL